MLPTVVHCRSAKSLSCRCHPLLTPVTALVRTSSATTIAKAIDRRHGAARIASLLQQHPAAFFRAFIDFYRENSAVPAKFSRETEAYIESIPLQ